MHMLYVETFTILHSIYGILLHKNNKAVKKYVVIDNSYKRIKFVE
jgi:hypothetical protein